jgi:DNA-binding MarR family transcriptional regulator
MLRDAKARRGAGSPRSARRSTAEVDRTKAPVEGTEISLGASLMTLANLMRRTTSSRFQRMYGLTLVDGWVVTRLGPSARISLDELAHRSGLAKSQMSRSVTNMVARKLVSRTKNPQNNAEVVLTLTPRGRAMYDRIIAAFPGFNRLLTNGLDDEEVALLSELIGRLIENSRRNLRDEQNYSRGQPAER